MKRRGGLEADLRLLADTDFLTGVNSRRRFEHEVTRALREGARFGDLVTDVVGRVGGDEYAADQALYEQKKH